MALLYRAWKCWQNWECNILCLKNSQLDCSKQSHTILGSIPPVNRLVTYPPIPGISTNILPIWVSGSLHLQIVRFNRRAEKGKYVYLRCVLAVKWCLWVVKEKARASFPGRGNLFDFLWRETMEKRSGWRTSRLLWTARERTVKDGEIPLGVYFIFIHTNCPYIVLNILIVIFGVLYLYTSSWLGNGGVPALGERRLAKKVDQCCFLNFQFPQIVHIVYR